MLRDVAGVIVCVGSFFFLLLLENIVFLDTEDDEVKVDGLAADLATAVPWAGSPVTVVLLSLCDFVAEGTGAAAASRSEFYS